MEAKELRICNLVFDKDGREKSVFAVLNNGVVLGENEYIGTPIEWIKPIPLTEEWLNRCKFNFKQLGLESLSVAFGVTKKDIHFVMGNYYKKIQFVHQLQNLYFELAQTELIISEKL